MPINQHLLAYFHAKFQTKRWMSHLQENTDWITDWQIENQEGRQADSQDRQAGRTIGTRTQSLGELESERHNPYPLAPYSNTSTSLPHALLPHKGVGGLFDCLIHGLTRIL